MDVSPKGEGEGATESIEVKASIFQRESHTRLIIEAAFPAGIEPTFKV
jgi:hypothetical protein